MKLTLLGTGNAQSVRYFNTCFVMHEGEECFLVDGGGGNGVLRQLQDACIDLRRIRTIFVTHHHIDHLLGVLWVIRVIGQAMGRGEHTDDLYIYAHKQLRQELLDLVQQFLPKRVVQLIGKKLHFIAVKDGQTVTILDRPVTFFNVHSTKAKQVGFRMQLADGTGMLFCGDEPYREEEAPYAKGCSWMLHEAFCRHADADRFHPYEKSHSTVRDACMTAQTLGIPHLVLFHTEDQTPQRQINYLHEGRQYYDGDLYVPEDLDTIEL